LLERCTRLKCDTVIARGLSFQGDTVFPSAPCNKTRINGLLSARHYLVHFTKHRQGKSIHSCLYNATRNVWVTIVAMEMQLYIFFSHYLINDTVIEKRILKILFFLQLWPWTFLILKNSERYRKRTHVSIESARFQILTLNPLTWRIWWAPNNASRWQIGFNSAFVGLIRTAIFLTGFRTTLKYQILWKSVEWGEELSHAHGKTRTNLTVAFRNVAN